MLNKNFHIIFVILIIMACQPVEVKHEVSPIEIKPIHITIDLNVKIDKALDDYFGTPDKTSAFDEDLYIQKLVTDGIARENDRGYIEYFGADSYAKNLITKENERRRIKYRDIANDKNSSTEVVEKIAAEKIQKKNRSGMASYDSEPIIEKSKLKRRGKFYALIIGINRYKYYSLLETPINDAKEVEMVLKDKYGFETILLIDEDATRTNIIGKLNFLRKKLFNEDSLIIYFAGHGLLIKGTAYWLPIEALEDDDTNWIQVDTITTILKRLEANHVLIVADSCYSGAFRKSSSTTLTSKAAQHFYIKKMRNKKSRILLSSGGKEPVTDDGKSGHSVFANAFITGLKEIEEPVFTVDDLFFYWIREPVAGNAKQTPTNEAIENSGHEGGVFIFFKKDYGG